jgi:hypothetical protein
MNWGIAINNRTLAGERQGLSSCRLTTQDQYNRNERFCTNSKAENSQIFFCGAGVIFVPCGIVLKDERRTSNIERPTSNKKRISDTEHSTAISVSF